MKKLLALLLALCTVMALAACQPADNDPDIHAKSEGVMTHAEYIAAEVGTEVTVECFVQATQSWWDNKITIYAQDKDGGYFLYNMVCSEDLSKQLVPGTKIRAKGNKAVWSGEIEIMEGTLEVLEGSYIAEPVDVTAELGTDALESKQNMLASFKGMTVVAKKDAEGNDVPFLYNWDGSGAEGNDIYFDVSVNGKTYTFTMEQYLTADGTDAYEAAQALQIGDVIDMTGFLYWYEGVQPHIISITPAN